MDLDRTVLNDQDRQIADGWEALFASFGWQLIQRRFGPRLEATQHELGSADNLLDLGRIQGQRFLLSELILLETNVETELNNMAAQAEPWEGE